MPAILPDFPACSGTLTGVPDPPASPPSSSGDDGFDVASGGSSAERGGPLDSTVTDQLRTTYNRPAPGSPAPAAPSAPAVAPRPRPHPLPTAPGPAGAEQQRAAAQRRAAFASPGAAEASAEFAELDRPSSRAASGSRPRAVAQAGLAHRFAASTADLVISLVVVAFAGLLSEVAWLRSDGAVSVPIEVFALAWYAFGWLVVVLGDGFSGASFGKRLFHLRVCALDGRPAPWWRPLFRRLLFDLTAGVVAGLALWLMLRRQGLLFDSARPFASSDLVVFAAFAVNLVVLIALLTRLDPQHRSLHARFSRTRVLPRVVVPAPEPVAESVVKVKPRPLLKQRQVAPVIPDYLRVPGDDDPDLEERPPRPRVLRRPMDDRTRAVYDHPRGVDAPRGVLARFADFVVSRIGYSPDVSEPRLPGESADVGSAAPAPFLYVVVNGLLAPARALEGALARRRS